MEQAAKKISHNFLQQAAEWFAVIQSGSVTDQERKDWKHWLSLSDNHLQAWHKVENISHRFDDLPVAASRAALDSPAKSGISRRQILKVLAVAFVSTGVVWQVARQQHWAAQYRTARGEIRQINLEDGSKIWVNTNSAVDVAYTENTRQIILHSGEIYIETAADIAPYLTERKRPLVVDTKFGRLYALGTRFSVRDSEDAITLKVMQGAVEVNLKNQRKTRRVDAGQQVSFGQHAIKPTSQLESSSSSPWIKGMILADNMRLDDFVDELNRYHKGYLSVDASAADLRLVGAYPVDDVDRILVALEDSLPITVSRTLPWWVSIKAK